MSEQPDNTPQAATPNASFPLRTPRQQLALQCAAIFAVLSLAWPYYLTQNLPMPWRETSLVIGGIALMLSTLSRQPWWWRIIHAIFLPMVWLTSQWAIDPVWFLGGFIFLLLIYRGALSGQIPLYFSNQDTVRELARLIEAEQPSAFLDLGAGIGSTTIPLSDHFPDTTFTGVENAPLTWLVGRLLGVGRPNLVWCWEDFWKINLASQSIVYAFLSPAPMERLWKKARTEMQPGSLFVSNTFPVPGITPTRIIEVDCTPPRPLYLYEM